MEDCIFVRRAWPNLPCAANYTEMAVQLLNQYMDSHGPHGNESTVTGILEAITNGVILVGVVALRSTTPKTT